MRLFAAQSIFVATAKAIRRRAQKKTRHCREVFRIFRCILKIYAWLTVVVSFFSLQSNLCAGWFVCEPKNPIAVGNLFNTIFCDAWRFFIRMMRLYFLCGAHSWASIRHTVTLNSTTNFQHCRRSYAFVRFRFVAFAFVARSYVTIATGCNKLEIIARLHTRHTSAHGKKNAMREKPRWTFHKTSSCFKRVGDGDGNAHNILSNFSLRNLHACNARAKRNWLELWPHTCNLARKSSLAKPNRERNISPLSICQTT